MYDIHFYSYHENIGIIKLTTTVKFPGQLRLKLFQQPQVQAFVAWVEEEDDEEDESEDEEDDE
jgi:hypothetical protein